MMKRFWVYLIVLFAAGACTSRLENPFSGGMDPSLEGKPVTVTFSVPATRLSPMTKGIEGEEGQKHIEEYADPKSLRHKCMLERICREMGFDSLGYQSLDGLLEAIGIDKDKICTYCWDGRE